jgi:hypothetical protein
MCVGLESVPAGAGLFFYLGLNIVLGMALSSGSRSGLVALISCLLTVACFLVLVLNMPKEPGKAGEELLIPRITTDKEIYMAYEVIVASYDFVNPNPYPVEFTPPETVTFSGGYKSKSDTLGAVAKLEWVSVSFTVPPGGVFHIMDFRFPTSKGEGDFEIRGMGLVKVVKVLPLTP